MANHYVSTFPDSMFVNHLIVARVTPGQRQTLFDRTLTRRGATEEHSELASGAELRDVLQDSCSASLCPRAAILTPC